MGIYAQTDITIECKNNKAAKAVAKAIRQLKNDNSKGGDYDFNYDYENLCVSGNYVNLFKSSGRIQNLEYQCEQLWEAIKGIKDIEMHCPFLVEEDGKYFKNESHDCDICKKSEDDDGRCACTNNDSK